jgi:hypothetical protein
LLLGGELAAEDGKWIGEPLQLGPIGEFVAGVGG